LLQRTLIYYAAKQKISIEELARRIEGNDDEYYLFLTLRIGYCYI